MNNTLSAHLGLHSVEESDESIIYLIYSKDGVENKQNSALGGGVKKKIKEKIIQFKLLTSMHDSLE